jgi:alkylation response protein AidB-like acyl-CoA dehydrogenase
LLAQYAAWQADHGGGISRIAALLLAMAGDLAREVTAEAIQMHGAFGITEEAEPQRYFRRAAIDAMLLGTPMQLREEAITMSTTQSTRAEIPITVSA